MKNKKIERLFGGICPNCGKPYHGIPATSRSNGAPICPDCGIREALESVGVCESEREEILGIIHNAQHG